VNKAQINTILSLIASKYESDIERICKETNTYYPPKWYKSIRGSRNYDYLFKEMKTKGNK